MNRTSLNRSEPIFFDNSRFSFFEYLCVFVTIIYAGQGSTFVRSVSFTDGPVGYSLPIILSIILAIKWKIVFNKRFYQLIFCFFLYFIAITIKYKEIHASIFLNYLLIFFTLYVLVKVFNINFFSIYEHLIFYFALIAIVMWGIQIILRGDNLYNLLNKIPGIQLFSYITGGAGVNIIIYSVQSSASSLLYNFTIPRNCGFAWEPGGFAVFLCLAIFINLFITNFNNKWNLHFWIFAIALISTQSTTGYSIFIVLLLFYYINKRSNAIVIILPLFIIAIISVFSLPFMSDKIISLAKETTNIDYIVWQSIGSESGFETQRFTSFLIAFRDFQINPILGTAGISGENWYNKIGANVSPISGIGNLMATFGIVGFLFFITFTFKTSTLFSKYFNFKGRYLLFIIFLLITISYSIIFLPLIMYFWMFSYFVKRPVSQNQVTYLIKSSKNIRISDN